MAKEIMCLGKPDGDHFVFLFFWQVISPVALPGWDGSTEQGGANVVPTPSSSLPIVVVDEFTAAEKAALDAGAWAFIVVGGFNHIETASQIIAVVDLAFQVRGSEHNHRYLLELVIGLDFLKNFPAVDFRHTDIKQ